MEKISPMMARILPVLALAMFLTIPLFAVQTQSAMMARTIPASGNQNRMRDKRPKRKIVNATNT